MTTKEAIQAMLDGNKCKKTFWKADCFCKFDGDRFIDELGRVLYSFGDIEWEIYEEPKPKETVTMEKWLGTIANDIHFETTIEKGKELHWFEKVKLIDTYEVKL